MSGAILRRFAAEVADVVARAHEGQPLAELVVWLQMALRREASVGEVYGAGNLEARLGRLRAPRAILDLVRTAIFGVWAQERAHAAYLEAVLAVLAPTSSLWPRASAKLEGLMGAMEGVVLSAVTSQSALDRLKASLLLSIGRRVQDVPAFVGTLGALHFGEFCRFNADLEVTAVHGYERMLLLLEALPETPMAADATMAIDVGRMLVDERFHHEVFHAIADWFEPGERADVLKPEHLPAACAAELAGIRRRAYGA
jgi:hypothetical protein